nr:restriction endonuclease subunit S [Haemophilus paracuniculus]
MNQPNILDLIKNYEVEWKPLSDVLVRAKGTKITAGQMKELHKDDAPVKIFAGGKTFAFVNFDDIPSKDINEQPSIIVKSRGIIEFEYYDKPFSHKNEMWSYHSQNDQVLIKFIYYFLKQNEPYFQNIGSKMQMPQIATPDTDKFTVPIPPLEIQEKIVKILDKFTELEATLEATLEAELTLRKKQYEFYRNELLTFDDEPNAHPLYKALSAHWNGEVVWRSLGEMASIKTGQAVSKQKISNNPGIYPVINSGREPLGYIDEWNTDNDPIGITSRGAGVGSITWQLGKYYRGNLNYSVTVKDKNQLDNRFLYFTKFPKEYSFALHLYWYSSTKCQ